MGYIKKIKFHVFFNVSKILPNFRLYGLRRTLLILAGLKIEKNVRIAGPLYVTQPNISIGSKTWIGPNFKVYVGVDNYIKIGKNVDIAPEVSICTGSHEIGNENRRAGKGKSLNITIEDGVWIGIRSTILLDTVIGEGCIIGAGSLVNKTTEKNFAYAGVPIKKLKKL